MSVYGQIKKQTKKKQKKLLVSYIRTGISIDLLINIYS